MEDDDLEDTIRRLIDRRDELPEDSPEYRFVVRQLRGLYYSGELAAGMIEDLDHFGWFVAAHPLPKHLGGIVVALKPRQ